MSKNYIHPTSIIGDNVTLGVNNHIGPFCYIIGDTIIGNNNKFEAYCSIGTPPEHRDYFNSKEGKTIIGDNNIIREFVTINAGTKNTTILNNDITLLKGSHIGHDCVIEDKVNLSCNVLIGGHSYLMEGSNFGLGSACHQFSTIGAYSMIGMNSTITKNSNIIPGKIYVGSPSKLIKENILGLKRNKISPQKLEKFIKQYNNILKNEI